MKKLTTIAVLSVFMSICGHCGWYLHGYLENKKAENAKNAMTAVSKNLAKNPLAMFMWQWQNTAVSTKTNAEAKPERVKLTPEQALEQEETKLKKMVNKMERYLVRMAKDGKVTSGEMKSLAEAYDKFEENKKNANGRLWSYRHINDTKPGLQTTIPELICDILSIYYRGCEAHAAPITGLKGTFGDTNEQLKGFFMNLAPANQDNMIIEEALSGDELFLRILLGSIFGPIVLLIGACIVRSILTRRSRRSD